MQRHIKNVEAKLNSQQQAHQEQVQAHQEQEQQQQQQQNQQQHFDSQIANASVIHQVGYVFFLLVYFNQNLFLGICIYFV